ncbi:Sfk1p [Saccharomyces eubayanus]|uniref:Sfk1p n=1 Tax=Saccharomyces eubayanus TaxID=1080349 RepID=UPI0006C1C5EF|nr:SFK1-like protein [Saccharomyces eubayanus]KOG98270.1 SFK1-like protein [Saccharomyces eubayanus]
MSQFKRPGNWLFIVPWIAFIPWYGMLIAMLACWAGQGHPIYWFMHTEQFPVYISDIGATNLRPLFISCAAWQGLGYVITVACEFFQRSGYLPFQLKKHDPSISDSTSYAEKLHSGKFLMPPYYTKDERNLIFTAFVFGCIGELGLLFCSIFSTAHYHHVHVAMVSVFVVFMFLSICCLSAEYFLMGRHYASIHPLANSNLNTQSSEKSFNQSFNIVDDLPWYKWQGHIWNKFTISATLKTIWLALAVVWAICFGAINDRSKSACFEWLLAFWFGVIFIILSVDFYMGGRYRQSRYFKHVESFSGYYKYDKALGLYHSEEVLPSEDNADAITTETASSNNHDNTASNESLQVVV